MDNRRRMLLSGGLSADPVLENNDWATISKVARAGKAAEYWNIGDTKNITINGTTYTVRIIGFDHDDVTDQATYGRAKAGITFETTSLVTANQMHSKYPMSGGWGSCNMRNSTLVSYYNSLSDDLKNAIVSVNKTYALSSSNIKTISDKLFLLSMWEYLGSSGRSLAQEGNYYAFYAAGNSTRKQYNGTYSYYWTRSAADESIYYFGVLTTSNKGTNRTYVDSSYGQAVAFCV